MVKFQLSFMAAAVSFGLVFPNLAKATNVVVVFEARVDDNSSLIIQGNTVQWTNNIGSGGGIFAAPGRIGGFNYPTIISTTQDGVSVMNYEQWTPTWPTSPPDEVRYLASSSVFSSLNPGVGNLSLADFSWAGRGLVTLVETPDASNKYTTIVNFSDYFPPFGGDGVYGVTLTYGTPPLGTILIPPYLGILGSPEPGVPELSTWAMMMLGFTGLGLAAYRRDHLAAVKAAA